MDKIAIISDIHGNLEALKAVLEDIKKRNIDKVYCIGDLVAKGSHPKECIEIVKDTCDVVIKGNCDEFFSTVMDLTNIDEENANRIRWNQSHIGPELMKYLNNLPFSYEFYLSGRLVRLVHAHPERVDKFAGNIDKINHLYELVLPSENTISNEKADVLVYGHIHTPFVQKIYNRFIINTGSVGNSFDVFRNDEKDGNVKNTTVANYLILNGKLDSKSYDDGFSFEIVSLPYDIDKEIENSSDNPNLEPYIEELKTGSYRDMEKIYNSFKSRGIDKEDV